MLEIRPSPTTPGDETLSSCDVTVQFTGSSRSPIDACPARRIGAVGMSCSVTLSHGLRQANAGGGLRAVGKGATSACFASTLEHRSRSTPDRINGAWAERDGASLSTITRIICVLARDYTKFSDYGTSHGVEKGCTIRQLELTFVRPIAIALRDLLKRLTAH